MGLKRITDRSSAKRGPADSVGRSVDVLDSPLVCSCLSPLPFSSSDFWTVDAPWDLLRGFDVFRDAEFLNSRLSEASLAHFAPNCATFSRAREIPIQGASNAPRPLRSLDHPRGIPGELERMNKKQRSRLESDTSMADLSAEKCFEALEAGRYFSLEHPEGSLARELESWKKLSRDPRVLIVKYTTCMFEGSERKKRQILITNVKTLEKHVGKVCNGSIFCDRTGKRHKRWRPRVSNGKVLQFSTGEEREYPYGFCRAYAEGVAELGSKGRFIEIFSGPNAPLSHAVAALSGGKVPGKAVRKKGLGVSNELHKISQLLEDPKPASKADAKSRVPAVASVESLPFRLAAVESGRQPSYGKRTQLIPDGLNDPQLHFREALRLKHPFGGDSSLKTDHLEAIRWQGHSVTDNNLRRLKALAEIRVLAAGNEQLGLIEDTSVPSLCLQGMPIVGDALESEFFIPYLVPASVSLKELLRTAERRRGDTLRRIARMAESSGLDTAVAIFEKTKKEVKQGTMTGPMSCQEVTDMFGKRWNLVPSFGLHQGEDEHGQPKYRRIDDHTAAWNNLAATRKQKIPMAMIDYVVNMTRELFKSRGKPLHVSTEDMRGAYRQVPLSDSQTSISVTGVYNPNTKSVELYLMHGQPFGAGHAVPNFYRVAEWISRLLIRAFGSVIDHFFDDFFLVSVAQESKTASFCVKEVFGALGFLLDPEKTQIPSEVSNVLGVVINTSSLTIQRSLLVEPKPTRKKNLVFMIDKILELRELQPTVAASLVGKFGFLCSTMYGKVGRCCTNSIRARQYSLSGDFSLSNEIVISLKLMRLFVQTASPRMQFVDPSKPPVILYTDASDVPERDPRFVVGAVLFDPESNLLQHTSWVVPLEVVNHWLPKETYMGQLEILAGPLAISTWSSILTQRQVIHFVDNDSAAACLVKGYSSKTDSSGLVGTYWLAVSDCMTEPYIDRVESKSNLADGPSRLSFDEVLQLGSTLVAPIVHSLLDPLSSSSHWFF